MTQLDFLRLLSHFKTEEEVRELNDLVCKYYAQKIDEEMYRLWDEGKWSHEKIEETLKEHLRTPSGKISIATKRNGAGLEPSI